MLLDPPVMAAMVEVSAFNNQPKALPRLPTDRVETLPMMDSEVMLAVAVGPTRSMLLLITKAAAAIPGKRSGPSLLVFSSEEHFIKGHNV